MVAIIDFKNESGLEGHIEINNPYEIHHYWYSSKRNAQGIYEKHAVTRFGAIWNKLKKCTNKRVVIK